MKKSELKKCFLDELQKTLEPYEFRLVRAMDWFARKNGNITQIFQVSFHNTSDGFGIVLGLGIRIQEVEKIYHEACNIEKIFRSHTLTINPALREISKDVRYEYYLHNLEDIDSLTKQFSEIFCKFVLPSFQTKSSIEEIDKILNDYPNVYSPYYGTYLRQYKGIIVAKLNNRENFENLVSIYKKKLKEIAGDFYIENYENILKILKDNYA